VSRIRRGYEDRFRALLQRVGARRLDQGVQWCVAKARHLSASRGVGMSEALAEVYEKLAARKAFRPPTPALPQMRFLCDAGLGGLARWLRAAGYEVEWEPGIADDNLLRRARRWSAGCCATGSSPPSGCRRH
jgi:hypothetical protein